MHEILSRIGEMIERVAREEEFFLKSVANQRIFHMPELAFSYACGKEIMCHRKYVFGDLHPEWKRETVLGDGGPTDLLFELPNNKSIAIEFKLRGTGESYIRDIEKLLGLDQEKYAVAFCALVDAFSDI